MGDWALTLKRLWSLFEVPLKKADLFSIGKTQWALCVPLWKPPPQHSELGYRTQRTGFWFHLTKNGNSFSYVKFQRCVNKAALWSHVVLFLWCHIFLLVQGGSCLFFLFYYLKEIQMFKSWPLKKYIAFDMCVYDQCEHENLMVSPSLLDLVMRLHFQFSLSCIGKGNGNPLQCSCLENPRDAGAWWAAVYGVAQSWTWLKWLSIAYMPTWFN